MLRKKFRTAAITFAVMAALLTGTVITYGAAAPAPKAPTGLTAKAASSSSIQLSWKAAAGVAGYEVYSSKSAATGFTLVGKSATVSYTVTKLTASTKYFFKVRAYTAAKVYSPYTAVVNATTAAGTSSAAANYKGVVFYADPCVFELSAEAFSGNKGLPSNLGAGSELYSAYIWTDDNNWPKLKKAAVRYFRVNLTTAEKKSADKWYGALAAGQAPTFNFDWEYNTDKTPKLPTGTKSLPADTTKIYFSPLADDSAVAKQKARYKAKDYAGIAADYAEIQHKIIAKITATTAGKKAKIYVGSMLPVTSDWPRMMSEKTQMVWDAGALMAMMGFQEIVFNNTYRAALNNGLKDMCAKYGYTFVDLSKCGVVGKDGFLDPKYAHEYSQGGLYNQAGTNLVGDYICKAMGLKTAKEMYNLK